MMKSSQMIQWALAAVTVILVTVDVQGQEIESCAYRATPEDYKRVRALDILRQQNPERVYLDNVVKVAMYRIRHDDGSGALSDTAFASEINNLNSYYDTDDICFALVRIVNVDNSGYINANWGDADVADSLKGAINSENPSFDDALTIYVLPPEVFYRGSAYGIPSTALLMTSCCNRWGTSHIAHEVGHCLGNFHTHDDTEGASLELVTRFAPIPPFPTDAGLWWDCLTGADILPDTPADPKLSDTNDLGDMRVDPGTCAYVDTLTRDGFGDLYTPRTDLIMSYAPIACRNDFSGMQGDRMHNTLDLNAEYSNKQAQTSIEFNGDTWSSGMRHELAKTTIDIANSSAFTVSGSAEIVFEAENSITLHEGAVLSPGVASAIVVIRSRDLCDNDVLNDYVYD